MGEIHGVGPWYVQWAPYPRRGAKLVERGWTNEIEEPYRYGNCYVVRVPRTRYAVALGRWSHTQDEETALRRAIGWRELGDLSLSTGRDGLEAS